MSLAAQGAYGAGAGAMGNYVPQPRFTAQQPQQPAADSSSAFRTKQVTSVSGGDESRGELVGDACCTLSLDHGRNCIDIATWSERKSRCQQLESQSAVMQLTEEGVKSVAAASGGAVPAFARHPFADLPAGVEILGSSGASSAGDSLRLLDCLEGDKKTARHGVDLDPSPLLAHLVVRSVKAGMSAEGMGSAAAEGAASSKKAAAKAAGQLGNNTVTLVLPVSYSYAQQAGAMKAVQSAGYTLRNVFHRGLATVATHVMESRESLGLGAAKAEASKSDDFVVLYARVDPDTGTIEAAVIGCECHTPSGKQKKDRIIDRLYCLTTADGPAADASRILGELLSGPALRAAGSAVQAVVVVGGAASLGALPAPLSGAPVIAADARDAVKGGCYLSAAELDSSKQYINVDNKWVVAYQLPIADGFLPFDIGMSVESSAEGVASPVETIFQAGTRIQKREMGVVRPRAGNEPLLVHKSDYANLKQEEQPVWPKVQALTRRRTGEAWESVVTLQPLLSVGATREGVETCTVILSLDAATGLAKITTQRGALVREQKQAQRSTFRLVMLCVAIVVAIVGGKLALVWREQAIQDDKVAWLTDFYREHAPEKLENMTSIRVTVNKFNGKLWALQRSLESKYKTKMRRKAPDSPDL